MLECQENMEKVSVISQSCTKVLTVDAGKNMLENECQTNNAKKCQNDIRVDARKHWQKKNARIRMLENARMLGKYEKSQCDFSVMYKGYMLIIML